MTIERIRAARARGAWPFPLMILLHVPACVGQAVEDEGDRAPARTAGGEDAFAAVREPEAQGEVVIDPQEHATDLPAPPGTVMSLPSVAWLVRWVEDALAVGGAPVLRFDAGRAGELLNVRVAVRPEHLAKTLDGREVADVDLGPVTLRLAREVDAGLGRLQIAVPATVGLGRAVVLKTYRRARVGAGLGPVELASIAVFDRDHEASGPVASVDVTALGGVSLKFDCDALAFEYAHEVPPVAVSFPRFSGCTLLECGKAKAGWLRATHDLYRFRQLLDYVASWPEAERAFLWQQQGADENWAPLHSEEDEAVGPNTAPAYFFGPYARYRFDAIRWAYSRLWDDFHNHDLDGLELDIECTPEAAGDLCNTHEPAGHHAVKSDVKLCEKAFSGKWESFDVPRLILHETMHHLFVPWSDGVARLSPLQDTHTHGHAATCLGAVTTDKGYGLKGLRHLASYVNGGGGDCYHRNLAFRNNDTYAYAAATLGSYLRFGVVRYWPLHLPPTGDDHSAPLECGLLGVDPPPPGFNDPLGKCEKMGGELVCPGFGAGGGLVMWDLDLAIVCPEG